MAKVPGKFKVCGTHGDVEFYTTGLPVGDGAYEDVNILQVDMASVLQAYKSIPPQVDILGCGFWYSKEGSEGKSKYEPPCEGWLKDRAVLQEECQGSPQDPKCYLLSLTEDIREVSEFSGSLREMYDLIGCDLIEVVRLSEDRLLVIDEEGKPKRREINVWASRLAEGMIRRGDCIVGPALYMDASFLE